MLNLNDLKNESSVESLTKTMDSLAARNGKDPTYWELSVDKAGNGYAVIRFLPIPHVDLLDPNNKLTVPYVDFYEHTFKGSNGYYNEKCLSSIGQEDPVNEYNSKLWASGVEQNKNIARAQKRKQRYVSNIKVIKDSAHPENNGKIFRFKYGKKILEKLKEKMAKPVFDGDVSFNPWCPWEGANFRLKARQDGDYRSYDKSEFETQSRLESTDEEISNVWKSEHSLLSEVSSDKFKSYDVLKKNLDRALGISSFGAKNTSLEDTDTTEVLASLDSLESVSGGNEESMDLYSRLAE